MEKIKKPIEVINEDGTPLGFEFPKNPLKEKWDKLYPPIPMSQYSQVCDGYSCMWCDRCPHGSGWKVPEEDKEVWSEYQKQIERYHKIHNPSMITKLENYLEKLESGIEKI